jgi:CBS domain-containing protein
MHNVQSNNISYYRMSDGNKSMSIESIPVSSLMSKNVKTQTSDQNIRAVCRIMHENNIGSVVIVNHGRDHTNGNNTDNKPVGIITERDIVRIIGTLEPSLLVVPVHELMSKPLITISPNNSVKEAMLTMQAKNIRRIVVVEKEGKDNNNNNNNNKMVGIITDKDIFRAIMENQSLIPSILNDELLTQHKPVYEQFSEYWFGDILHKR